MEKFIEFAKAKGLILEERDIIADGSIHRVPVEGAKRNGSKDGAYCIYAEGVGWVKNFKTGESGSISLVSGKNTVCYEDIQKKVVVREKKELETQNTVARSAEYLIKEQFKIALHHKYLYTKKILAYGSLVDKYGVLIIPIQNIRGEIRSFQRIYEDGTKSFLKGGQKKACFFKIGEISDIIIICEGYATACSIYESSKITTLAAMDALNLLHVSMEVRAMYGDKIKIIIAGDDDRLSDDNPGRYHAIEAAKAVQCVAVLPKFTDKEILDGLTDFNDLHSKYGKDVVKRTIFEAINE